MIILFSSSRNHLSRWLLRKSEERMDEAKKKRLTTKGWKVGNADEFLGLTPEEAAYVERHALIPFYIVERSVLRLPTLAAAAFRVYELGGNLDAGTERV